ncbi:MAG: glycosyltransferase [Flavobacteriaceae bacterium]|nr:glycosyltransferase [Flavobacteriaceae bacterium]
MNKMTEDKPIRVLQVLGMMDHGGAEVMAMNYYRGMDKSKVQFDFLLHFEEAGVFDEEIRAMGGNIYIMPRILPANYFKYKKALKHFFATHKDYDIVHSHINAYGTFVIQAAKKAGILIRISHSHTSITPWYKKIFEKNINLVSTVKEIVQNLLRPSLVRNATVHLACGEKAGKWMYGSKSKNFIVINNAIDAKRFRWDATKRIAKKKELGLEGIELVGHVGNFNEAKNHKFIVQCFASMLQTTPNLKLLLVGGGGLFEEIQEEVQQLGIDNKVLFLGSRNDVDELLQAFDLMLFPSIYEGLPLTLVEAQAAGLPVLASANITTEIAITDILRFLPLADGTEAWATAARKQMQLERKDTLKAIQQSGYDLEANAKMLQNLYLEKIKECAE